MKVGNYTNTLSVEKGVDGNITLHLKGEILTVWFDAWRYEREEQFALIAFMKTIAYTMADNPYYQDIKKILLRGIGIIGKDVLRHFATQYAMTSEGWSKLEQKLLPQMDLLSTVDKDTIYFEGLRKIKEEMKKLRNTQRIVIFIDDLDRCNAKKAVEVFESTKAFLDIEGFIFVIGLSIDTLYKLITKEYEGVEIKGEEYIRKIIQVYINLPAWDQMRIDRVIEKAAEELNEKDHEFFKDKELIAKAANYNPREVKRIVNRCTISNYLDEIDPTIFIIIQAFESRWYNDLYKKLDDSSYRSFIRQYLDKPPQDRADTIQEGKRLLDDRTHTFSENEKAFFAIDKSFWNFVDNPKYQNKIIDIIENWDKYKEKYRKSAEPTEQIKSAQDKADYEAWVSDYEVRLERTRLGKARPLQYDVMKQLCQKKQGEELSVYDIPSARILPRETVDYELDRLEDIHYIVRLPNGNIRLTDEGRTHCIVFDLGKQVTNLT